MPLTHALMLCNVYVLLWRFFHFYIPLCIFVELSICCICRAEYNPDQYLWESDFTLAGRKYKRQDLEASMSIHNEIFSFYFHYLFTTIYIMLLVCCYSPLSRLCAIWILQLRNQRGHTLQCSHYLPSPLPEDTPLPCVIYCHGNRFLRIALYIL